MVLLHNKVESFLKIIRAINAEIFVVKYANRLFEASYRGVYKNMTAKISPWRI